VCEVSLFIQIRLLILAGALLLTGCNSRAAAPPGTGTALTIEEYAVVERSVDQPTHFEFNERIGAEVKARRAQWRNQPPPRCTDAQRE